MDGLPNYAGSLAFLEKISKDVRWYYQIFPLTHTLIFDIAGTPQCLFVPFIFQGISHAVKYVHRPNQQCSNPHIPGFPKEQLLLKWCTASLLVHNSKSLKGVKTDVPLASATVQKSLCLCYSTVETSSYQITTSGAAACPALIEEAAGPESS